MKPISRLIWIFSVALAARLCAGQENVQWLTWDDSAAGTPPEIKIIQSDANSTTFEVVIHGLFMESVEKETSQGVIRFSRIFLPRDSMSDYGTATAQGKPELPVIRRYFAVLSDTDSAVVSPEGYEIDDQAVATLEQVTVFPVQTFSSEGFPRLQFDFDESFYTSRTWYPISYDQPQELRFPVAVFHHLRVARAEIHPFACNPADRLLRVYRRFRVKVDHAGQLTELFPNTRTYEKMYRAFLANYELVRPLLPAVLSGRNANYLILTSDQYYAKVLPLASWKRAKGFNVAIQTVPSQVPNTPNDIRSAIRSYYDAHSPDDMYVLLVGDIEQVASGTCTAYEWNVLRKDSSSDIQYARVAGSDRLPDLFLGRIPADDAGDVENVVGKILRYEKASIGGDMSWLSEVLLVAHKQDYPGKYTACKERVRLHPYSLASPVFDAAYGGAGGTNSDVRKALEDGRGIVNYRGHGGADCWWTWGLAGQSFCISPDVANLTNGERTPVIFSVACLTNNLRSSDCIGEEFVELPQGGAVAYYGPSADSGTVANDYLDKNLFKAIFDEGIQPLGAAVNWAQVRAMEELPGSWAYSSEYNANIYILLGDPEMSIRTRPPSSFTSVEYPEWVEAGAQTVEVSVKGEDGKPVKDALVAVRKYRGTSPYLDVEASGYTNSEGKLTFVISPTTRGGLSVTFSKEDYVPYDGDSRFRVIHAERDPETASFSFSWQAEPGRSYAVYTSPTVGPGADWELTGITPIQEGLTMTLTDTTSGAARSRFYRVEAR